MYNNLFAQKDFEDLNGMDEEEHLIDVDKNMGMDSNEFEMNASTSADDLDKELTEWRKLSDQKDNSIPNFFKTCDTTSSPTSSTPIHVSTTPPLILSNSTNATTTHQEIVYNNNGYRIKSVNSEYDTNCNFEKNGSTKVIFHLKFINFILNE